MRTFPTLLVLALLGCDAGPAPELPPSPPQPASTATTPGSDAPWGKTGRIEVAAELLARFDTDGDAQLSRAEHARYAAPEPSFEALDRDSSGALDAAELLSALSETDPGFHDRWSE